MLEGYVLEFSKLVKTFTTAVENNDGEKLASLFTVDGIYDDYIYGEFKGRRNIAMMLPTHFHSDAKNFSWEMSDHVFREDIGYAKYMFAFTSKIPEYLGKKVVVSGISFFRFKSNSIVEYSESVNGGIAMVQLGVKPEKMQKVFLKWFKRSLEDDFNLRNFYESKSNIDNK